MIPDDVIIRAGTNEYVRQLEAELENARAALKIAANQVKTLAFKMPPPNEYTPQFVSISMAMEQAGRPARGIGGRG